MSSLRRARLPRLALALFLVALLAVGAAACGSDGSSDSTSTAATEEAGGGGSAELTTKPHTIGVIDQIRQSPIQDKTGTIIEEAAEKLGWSVDYIDAVADPAKVQAGMQTLINKDVDGIILNSIDPSSIPKQVSQAKSKGIPMIVVNGGIPQSSQEMVEAAYVEDEYKMGRIISDYIVETTPNAKIIGLLTSLNYSGVERTKALEEAAADGGAEIVAQQDVDLTDPVVNTQKATVDMLTANPDATSVYAIFDNMVSGAMTGVQQKRSDAKVYSYFTSQPNVEALESDTPLEAVADVDLAKTGALAMEAFVQLFENETPINPNALEEDPLVYEVVSRENIEEKLEGKSELFPNEEILAPFFEKWEEEFGS